MTLDEARVHVGHGVVYQSPGGRPEDGTITGVGGRYVFVRYRGDTGSKATDPAFLSLLAGNAASSGADEDSGRFPLSPARSTCNGRRTARWSTPTRATWSVLSHP